MENNLIPLLSPFVLSATAKKNYESFTFTLTHLFRCHPYMGNSRCVLLPIMQLNVVSIEKPMLNKRFVNYVAALPERSRKMASFVIMELERQTIRAASDIREFCHRRIYHRSLQLSVSISTFRIKTNAREDR